MTPHDRDALREAVEAAIGMFDPEFSAYSDCDLKRHHQKQAQTLRAWLASGLSDDERATVGKVVVDLRGVAASWSWRPDRNVQLTKDGKALLELAIDALRPIAESK